MTVQTARETGEAIVRGVSLLDKIYPDWYRKDNLSLDDFNLLSPCECILGQRNLGYWDSLAHLAQHAAKRGLLQGTTWEEFVGTRDSGERFFFGDNVQFAIWAGFELPTGAPLDEWLLAEVAWVNAVLARRHQERRLANG